MDPSQNPALCDAKLQTILQSFQQEQRSSNTTSTDASSQMPPPPAYHMVVDPNSPIPNMNCPYDAEQEEGKENEEDDLPEININASTQIRGHGNIISIAQMDTAKMAILIAGLLHGAPLPQPQPPPSSPRQSDEQGQQSQTTAPPPQARPERRALKNFPKVNITLNCGATVIGDRNIVGPGLGDIARHIQIAQQRSQALAAQQNQMNANRTAGVNAPGSGLGFPVHGQQQSSIATPPMSRSSSFGSEGSNGAKRKVEEGVEGRAAKRSC
ncbi:hypothetical protein CC80DRAFT_413406 [Byssothecium circinans]|uniref:Uncharacterized protein n=1 Tax=Byssothecium circinans TaxID=147558 RepID=A0A6A5TU78_9PLEO|nr:hypothetical protein CC80DRAFT_413406 [Byssothecium circinans]